MVQASWPVLVLCFHYVPKLVKKCGKRHIEISISMPWRKSGNSSSNKLWLLKACVVCQKDSSQNALLKSFTNDEINIYKFTAFKNEQRILTAVGPLSLRGSWGPFPTRFTGTQPRAPPAREHRKKQALPMHPQAGQRDKGFTAVHLSEVSEWAPHTPQARRGSNTESNSSLIII